MQSEYTVHLHFNKMSLHFKATVDCAWSQEQALLRIKGVHRKLRIASSQVMLIDNKIKDTEVRFFRAQKDARRTSSFRYIVRLKLCTLENIRNKFYDYAVLQADELERLQLEFMERAGLHEWDDALVQDPDIVHHTADIDLDDDEDYDEMYE